jgi:hypothetical protein
MHENPKFFPGDHLPSLLLPLRVAYAPVPHNYRSSPITTRVKRSGCCNNDENRTEQCFAAHIVHSCQQY